ncbi:MAG: hypothetical protein GAK31_00826 [Stenotrophomonas maltophilia]|uniref:DUF6265 domain-containing protein n=1 Tax=Stenotrophomonas maltophilia TaxID=40324 RepID=A0A7V8FK56_STEMA|nr:MAG: hypothetical protein GAK31_00826 [Stenotrophomonas maltophilia]
MHVPLARLLAAVVLTFTASLSAAHAQGSAPSTRIESLAWLAGCLQNDGAEPGSGEQWMPLAGGTLLGSSRTVRDGRTVAHEFMQIRQREDGSVVFIALPSGQQETTFVLSHQDDSSSAFSNAGHDFPQRVIYARRGVDRLHARIEGTHNHASKAVDFPMHRIVCAGGG